MQDFGLTPTALRRRADKMERGARQYLDAARRHRQETSPRFTMMVTHEVQIARQLWRLARLYRRNARVAERYIQRERRTV